MLGLACLTLGEHPGMLQQPKLIGCLDSTLIGKLLHSGKRGAIVHLAQLAQYKIRRWHALDHHLHMPGGQQILVQGLQLLWASCRYGNSK